MQGDLSDREVGNKQNQLLFTLFYYKHTSKMSSRFFISFVDVDESQVPAPELMLSRWFILTAVGVRLCRHPCWT